MTDKRNGVLVLFFSVIPGAGEMFLGMMRKGIIIMTAFCCVIGASSFFRVEALGIVSPVIWFYSFFDTLNMKDYTYAERLDNDKEFKDKFFAFVGDNWKIDSGKKYVFAGIGFLFLGLYMLFYNIVMPILYQIDPLEEWAYSILRDIPSIILALAIMVFGTYLIIGDKNKKKEKDFVEYKGDKNE